MQCTGQDQGVLLWRETLQITLKFASLHIDPSTHDGEEYKCEGIYREPSFFVCLRWTNWNANFLLVINTITLFCVSVAFSALPLLTFDYIYILSFIYKSQLWTYFLIVVKKYGGFPFSFLKQIHVDHAWMPFHNARDWVSSCFCLGLRLAWWGLHYSSSEVYAHFTFSHVQRFHIVKK